MNCESDHLAVFHEEGTMNHKTNTKIPRRFSSIAMALMLSGATVVQVMFGATAHRARAAEAGPSATQVLDCATTPFGSVLTLRQENEAFVSFRGGAGSGAGDTHADAFDLNSGGLLSRTVSFVGTTPEKQDVSEIVSTMADLDGSGTSELVHAMTKSGNPLRLASYNISGTTDLYTSTFSTFANLSIASGRMITNTNRREQVVMAASYTAAKQLAVLLVNGDSTGGLRDNTGFLAFFADQFVSNLSQTSVAVGDLDGDGIQNDIALVFIYDNTNAELVTLRYANGGITETARNELLFGPANNVRVSIGNIDGDYKSEVVVAMDTYSADLTPLSSQVRLFTFKLNDATPGPNAPGGESLVQQATWARSDQSTELAVTTGDTDNDGLGEIVLGYRKYADSALIIHSFDVLGTSVISLHNTFTGTTEGRESAKFLDVKAGDLNNDGGREIVSAFRDGGGQVQTLVLTDPFTPSVGLQVKGFDRNTQDGHLNATAISVALGDWNDDSLRAHYTTPAGSSIQCKTVEEPNIVAAVFAPPHWERLQGKTAAVPRDRRAWIGQSKGGTQSNETAMTVSRNHSVSGYVGVKAGGTVAGIGLEAEARATGGYEWLSTNTRRGSTGTTQTTNESWNSNDGSFVALERTTNDCYNYQLRNGATDLDAVFRFCEQKGYAEVATDVDNWDSVYGPTANAQALQWTPIGRDWANLALFHGNAAAQSSTDGSLSASRAADGNTVGTLSQNSVARTLTETNSAPWWQIDLGKLQEIRSVRVWNRDNVGCPTFTCNAALKDFYVFVSDTDFRTISNDPATLKNSPLVWTQFYTGSAGSVAGSVVNVQTFKSNKPIIGRYIRVQLANPGTLALAEVQAFGSNNLDPDRYPIAVTDPISNDGWFNALVYDLNGQIQTVRMRGNLKWNGANDGVLASKRVTVGNVVADWSLEEEKSKTSVEANSIGNTTKVGAEFDVSGGAGLQITAGGGYEFSTGLVNENIRSTGWTSGFVIGGGVQGLPTTVDGVTLGSQCEYGFQPYYYEVTDQASSGYQHRYIVVDYIVPDPSITRSNLDICRVKLSAPVIESQTQSGAPGSLFIMTAQGFPTNVNVELALKGPNDVAYVPLTTLKVNANGVLVFVLKTLATDPVGNYSVQLTASGAQASSLSAAQAVVASANIVLSTGAPTLNTTPGNNPPVVSTDPSVPVIKEKVFMPMLTR